MPQAFVDAGDTSFQVHYYVYDELQLSADSFPYRVFDVVNSVVGATWHVPASTLTSFIIQPSAADNWLELIN